MAKRKMKLAPRNEAAGDGRAIVGGARPDSMGKQFEARTPNSGFKGERQGVQFYDGVGYFDDPKVAVLFEALGYEVTEFEAPEEKEKEKEKDV